MSKPAENIIQAPAIVGVMARDLWSLDDIGLYLQLEKNTVKKKVALKTFPRAVGGGDMERRWRADEVKTWSKRRAA